MKKNNKYIRHRAARIEYLLTPRHNFLFIYLGMYLFHIGWGTIHQYPLMEKINIRYLKKEWICGARKIDIGCKSPFVLWQDSNYFQNNEPCLNGGLPRIVNGLVPRGSRQFQRNDHRHGPIVISQSLLGFDPWRPCEMYDLQNKNKQKIFKFLNILNYMLKFMLVECFNHF